MERNKNSKNQNTELTFESLKTYPGFENATEEESVKIISNIKRLAKVLYSMYQSDLKKEAEEKNNIA